MMPGARTHVLSAAEIAFSRSALKPPSFTPTSIAYVEPPGRPVIKKSKTLTTRPQAKTKFKSEKTPTKSTWWT